MAIATFGAGCFWKPEFLFRQIEGVIKTKVGYMGGATDNPTYEQVCSDKTGHAEVVQITYDPKLVNFESLLVEFWKMHDPTQLNRQGLDIGSQYRSVIFYQTDEEKEIAHESMVNVQDSGIFSSEIVTEIVLMETFWPAEEYHQQYYQKSQRR